MNNIHAICGGTIRGTGAHRSPRWCSLVHRIALPLVAALCAFLGRATAAPVRLAVVPENPELAQVADVLTVEFSRQPDVILLERQQIEKVYREQTLAAGRADDLKLGRLLGADALLLLNVSSESGQQFLKLRLIAVRPGIVVADKSFPWQMENLSDWAGGLVTGFKSLLPKLAIPARDAIPISVVHLSSAVRSAEAQELERQLSMLTVERLAREPQLFVLERQRMNLLVAEKEFQGTDTADFWNGSYLLEGTIDRDGYSPTTVTVHARLSPPKGAAPLLIEVTGNRTNLTEVITRLIGKVTQSLQLKSADVPWNPADEAERYFQEGNWAYRWHMFAEAQAASEAAWALGKKTKEVATLRLQAYTDELLQGISGSTQIEIKTVPEPAMLPAAIRAAELFCEDSRLFFTNSVFDKDWFDLGLSKTLRGGASLLGSFYYAAEARHGNEDSLSHLRTATKRVAEMLETNRPPVYAEQRCGDTYAEHPDGSGPTISSLPLYQWKESAFWCEKPEEALPIFRRLIEAGYQPEYPPHLVAWAWEDRKRVPGLRKQFTRALAASDRPGVRVEGRLLAVMDTPMDAEGDLERVTSEACEEIWRQREWVLAEQVSVFTYAIGAGRTNRITVTKTPVTSIMPRMEKILSDKYYVWGGNFDLEPYAGFKLRLLLDYLASCSHWNNEIVKTLSPSDKRIYSAAQLKEVDTAIVQAHQRLDADQPTNAVALSRRPFGGETNAPLPAQTGLADTSGASNSPITLPLIAWKITARNIDPWRRPQMMQTIWRANKLWSQVRYVVERWDTKDQVMFVGVDVQSGACEEILFPLQLGEAESVFEVTDDSLIAVVGNQLEQYRFRDKTWRALTLPSSGVGQIVPLNGKLYVTVSEGVLEVNPDSGEIQICASARRSPPANELDSLWSDGVRAFVHHGQLAVLARTNLFSLSPTNHSWSRLMKFPPDLTEQPALSLFEKAEIFTVGQGRVLFGCWDDAQEMQLLLQRKRNSDRFKPDFRMKLPPPLWSWPQQYPLEQSAVEARNHALWILTPRDIREGFRQESFQPVSFDDSRNATLLHFAADTAEPLSVPLLFEQNGKPRDPLEKPGTAQMMPFSLPRADHSWFETPDGWVLVAKATDRFFVNYQQPAEQFGHWLIPRRVLESRIQSLKSASARTNSIGGNPQ